MNWFTQLCRNLGLMVHNIRHPEGDGPQKTVIRTEVEEEQRGKVILRRTTIEEVEFKNAHPPEKDSRP